MGIFDALGTRNGAIKGSSGRVVPTGRKFEPLRGTTESTKETLAGGANRNILQRPNYLDFASKDKRTSDPRSFAPVKSKSGKINPKDPKTW